MSEDSASAAAPEQMVEGGQGESEQKVEEQASAEPEVKDEEQPEWKRVIPMEELGKEDIDDQPTALLIAAKNHEIERVKLLIEKGEDVNAQHTAGDLKGMSALHWLAGDGYIEGVRLLLAAGADVHLKDAWGQTALHHAIGTGQFEICRLLVDSGLDIHERDGAFGQSGIHWAAIKDHPDIVGWMLDLGADINEVDGDNSQTPAHLAAYGGGVSTLKVLVERGANLDIQDKDGKTALMLAGQQGHTKAFTTLLEGGASLTIKDKQNNTVEAYAHREQIREAFDKHKAKLKEGRSDLKRLYLEGIEEWDAEEVKAWLTYNKMEKLGEELHAQAVDGPRLLREGGALVSDDKLRGLFNKRLQEANRHHTKLVELKSAEYQWDLGLSIVTSLILGFLIIRFFRRLSS